MPGFDLDPFVRNTLAEDLGEGGDITSAAVIPADARFDGVMESRDSIVVAGLPIAEAFFRRVDTDTGIERLVGEGGRGRHGTGLMRFIGRERGVVGAEGDHLKQEEHASGHANKYSVPEE